MTGHVVRITAHEARCTCGWRYRNNAFPIRVEGEAEGHAYVNSAPGRPARIEMGRRR
jgi:hypothetical protein